jgi:hypothetical protein
LNCYCCGAPLIWGGDHDEEDDEGRELIVTNLSCTECDAFILVYWNVQEATDGVREDQEVCGRWTPE